MDTNEKIQSVKEWLGSIPKPYVVIHNGWLQSGDSTKPCMWFGRDITISDQLLGMEIRFDVERITVSMGHNDTIDEAVSSCYDAMMVMRPILEAKIKSNASDKIALIDAEIAVLMKKKEALNDNV